MRKMLSQFGIEESRLKLDWVAASEPDRFVATVKEMTQQIRDMGPFRRQEGVHG